MPLSSPELPKSIPAIAANPPKLPLNLLDLFVCGNNMVEAVNSFGVNIATNKPIAIKISVVLMTFFRPFQRVLARAMRSISSSSGEGFGGFMLLFSIFVEIGSQKSEVGSWESGVIN